MACTISMFPNSLGIFPVRKLFEKLRYICILFILDIAGPEIDPVKKLCDKSIEINRFSFVILSPIDPLKRFPLRSNRESISSLETEFRIEPSKLLFIM
ncbi:hypothetical protein HanPI659440_Chr04g0172921 [Helianthus annuus]|nr:hypothetical protein HanPI659440_Chr04g0172921 [Helianthus annuus]